jgi:hypothetical protein
VDAVNGADVYAGGVLGADTGFGDGVGHGGIVLGVAEETNRQTHEPTNIAMQCVLGASR